MTTLEDLFAELKKIPDWDRYPYPEVFYTHFNVKKPKPGEVYEIAAPHNPPPYLSLNEGGKTEIRGPAPGGVREIKEMQILPVEVKKVNEETGELEEYPPANKELPLEAYGVNLPDHYHTYLDKLNAILQKPTLTDLVGSPAYDDGKEMVDIRDYWKSKGYTADGKKPDSAPNS